MLPGPEPMRKRRYTDEETGISFTTIMDIVFIVLILFFAATFIVTETGPELAGLSGSPSAESIVETPPIVVNIDSTSLISIDGRLHERAVVEVSLQRLKAERPDAPLNIDVHPDADTEALAAVVEAARAVGIESVSVATGEDS